MVERWMRITLLRVELRSRLLIDSRSRYDFLRGVDVNVIAFGFDPINLIGQEEEDAPAGLNDQAFEIFESDLICLRRKDALVGCRCGVPRMCV